MKTKKWFILAMFLLVIMSGCKKEETLQPSGWDRFWHKETYVMTDLNAKHKDVILPKIDQIRTTLQEFVTWDTTIIQVHGPGGYTPTAFKSFDVWYAAYCREFMPDTTVPCKKGEIAEIIKAYLDYRRNNGRTDSFEKMWLCIPKEIYEQDPRIWEWWLTRIQDYLTVVLGGPDAWTDGTRQLWIEMEIYYLPLTPDQEDPWHSECSAKTRIICWYQKYAEGPDDKSLNYQQLPVAEKIKITNESIKNSYPNYEKNMQEFRKEQSQVRYNVNKMVEQKGFAIGTSEDYETKQGIVNGQEVYYLEILCVPE